MGKQNTNLPRYDRCKCGKEKRGCSILCAECTPRGGRPMGHLHILALKLGVSEKQLYRIGGTGGWNAMNGNMQAMMLAQMKRAQ